MTSKKDSGQNRSRREAAPDADLQNLLGVYSTVGERLLAHYDVRHRIGEGGQALVYKARDLRLRRWVAIKVLQPWAMGHASFRTQLIREAQAASSLNHPNIVTIHEVVIEKPVCFIVMEYVAGTTLKALIPTNGFPVHEALTYGLQIVDALRLAESDGILHGDLKPLNIMVTETGHVKLLDFGLAQVAAAEINASEIRPQDRLGTKVYMAPERLEDLHRGPDIRSEIFSVGLVLYEMLRGQHAFHSTHQEIPDAIQTRSANRFPKKVPADLVKAVGRCLEKNSKLRFQSMQSLYSALEKCAATKRFQQTSNSSGESKSPRTRPSEMRQVRAFLERIGSSNIGRGRQALVELRRIVENNPSTAICKSISSALQHLILTIGDFNTGVPAGVRELRKQAFDVLKASIHGDPAQFFGTQDLEYLDLYGMNFAGAPVGGMSFRGCFLVEANFEGCTLAVASFAGASLRNVHFGNADLTGADFSGADWFNALDMTEQQLLSIRQETLLPCPKDVRAMHRYLEARYNFPFESWIPRVQQELLAAWKVYLRPGGLRDISRKLQKS